MSLDTKVICWDLDDTLGIFDGIATEVAIELEEGRPAEPINPVRIRRGIKKTLESLSKKGFVHYVTSNNPAKYVKKSIDRAGLTSYFEDILGENEVVRIGGKFYRPVANKHNFNDEQARSNMVVMGNHPSDQPADLVGVVFIRDTNGPYTPSDVLEQLLYKLLESGDGNIHKGFKILHERTQTPSTYYEMRLMDGISFSFDYRKNPNASNIVIPTVDVTVDKSLLYKCMKLGLEIVNPEQKPT